jgi:hypothetical protein
MRAINPGSSQITVEKDWHAPDVIPSVARNLIELPQESRFLGLRPRNDKMASVTLIRDEPLFVGGVGKSAVLATDPWLQAPTWAR